MQEAVPLGQGAMAALLGLGAGAVDEICREAAGNEVVSAANLNSPAQIVIAGDRAAVERAVELAKARGARRAILLNVSAPFHCSLMKPAADRLAVDLDAVAISDPRVPLVNNADAAVVRTADAARDGLKRQVTSPVRWTDSMLALRREGADIFVEAGPGKVLSGLMRQIDREAQAWRAGDTASLKEVVGAVQPQ
jgi:[acyl-carrier-protein] S-malonyltransferase